MQTTQGRPRHRPVWTSISPARSAGQTPTDVGPSRCTASRFLGGSRSACSRLRARRRTMSGLLPPFRRMRGASRIALHQACMSWICRLVAIDWSWPRGLVVAPRGTESLIVSGSSPRGGSPMGRRSYTRTLAGNGLGLWWSPRTRLANLYKLAPTVSVLVAPSAVPSVLETLVRSWCSTSWRRHESQSLPRPRTCRHLMGASARAVRGQLTDDLQWRSASGSKFLAQGASGRTWSRHISGFSTRTAPNSSTCVEIETTRSATSSDGPPTASRYFFASTIRPPPPSWRS